VQPRVLLKPQIKELSLRLDTWIEKVKGVSDSLAGAYTHSHFSSYVHRITQFNSWMCTGVAQVERERVYAPARRWRSSRSSTSPPWPRGRGANIQGTSVRPGVWCGRCVELS